MFIINLNYLVPLEQLDLHMAAHVKFLNTWYKKNIFLTSGRKVPRTGGIIVAVGCSIEELQDIMKQDPFCKHNLAEFTITEFLNSQMHPSFKEFFEKFKTQS